jgi:hypothetical protein
MQTDRIKVTVTVRLVFFDFREKQISYPYFSATKISLFLV